MARDTSIIERRNEAIKQEFYHLEAKYPEWRYSCYLEKLGDKFWLAPATIQKILTR